MTARPTSCGFTTDTRVWPTNNISERDLRPIKTQQKISGRLTSEEGTQDRLGSRSYIDTARKQGINVMTAIRRAITGNPWRPPIWPEPDTTSHTITSTVDSACLRPGTWMSQ